MTNDSHSANTDSGATLETWQERLAGLEGWLRQVIRARTGEPHSVEDVYQQLALVICQRVGQLRDSSRFAPWSHRIAVVLSARHVRAKGRERRRIQVVGNEATNQEATQQRHYDPLAILLDRERQALVLQAMNHLPARDREMLVLKYEERLTYEDLASYLGITEKAVDRRLARARDRLRSELAKRGIGQKV
jgi:RNA polymerase sigma factor (sigma-70 family)